MYIYDFFRLIPRKSNLTILVYLIINIFLMSFIVGGLFFSQYPFFIQFIIGFDVYFLSLLISLSPLGEAYLRFQQKCKKLTRKEDINKIEPLFREVYAKARKLENSIPPDVQIYINEDDSPNAFATGRKTICICRGLLDRPDDEIKAVLAHEFGHLAHHDTDLILVVSVGNSLINLFVVGLRIVIDIISIGMSIALSAAPGTSNHAGDIGIKIQHLLAHVFIQVLVKIWTQIGVFLVMKSSRENEFEADEFAYNLGYGNDLCACLDSIAPDSKLDGLFASLEASHPQTSDRIGRLQSLGATYSRDYALS